jgi:hypothetical protein
VQKNKEVHNPFQSFFILFRNYEYMNYMMAFYSGLLFLTYFSNFSHVKDHLKKSAAEYSRFYNLTAMSWTFKPVFGWISDSLYPFRYR